MDQQRYVVNVFEQAAQRYSQDETTKQRGGLLGELVPQGYCDKCQILHQACFQVPLGTLEGPLPSEYGYHLVTSDRTDQLSQIGWIQNKVSPKTAPNDVFGTLVVSQQVGKSQSPTNACRSSWILAHYICSGWTGC